MNLRKPKLYIIRKGDMNIFKIGYTRNPERRLRSLQTANETKLTYVALFSPPLGMTITEFERKVHQIISPTIPDKQRKLKGEWWVLEPSWLHTIIFELTTRYGAQKETLPNV